MENIFIEAESFENLGGWVIDQQSIPIMGSSYIMAHGMGVPVQNASTKFNVQKDGEWTVYVRTRDWTSVWNRGKPGGIFKVLINGIELENTLGTNGSEWGWQKAGTIELECGTGKIELKDLSGFNGRCDAIYLTTDPKDIPANDIDGLNKLRSQFTDDPITCDTDFDLIVAGGGIAGVCTAFTALNKGLKVALIHDRSILGGCNSSEVRVGIGGSIHILPYENLGNVVEAIEPMFGGAGTYSAECYEDDRKKNIFKFHKQDQCRLALNECVIAVGMGGNCIRTVTSKNTVTGQVTTYHAKLFADCTGDAVVARLAGAETMYGQEAQSEYNEENAPEYKTNQVMGHSVQWYSKNNENPVSFPDIDWGIEFNDETALYYPGGDWEWEAGQYKNQVSEIEYIRDYGLMAVFANWSFIKNHSKNKDEWTNASLEWVSSIGGKRESYRVVGDMVLTQNDIEQHTPYPDASGSMSWNIDLHFPDPVNEELFTEPFRSCAYHRGIVSPYAVPYRCLYSKDVSNLFLGGRIISVTHVAFSCVRVMRTLGILGEVVGMAAKVCVDNSALPRDVYRLYFEQLKEHMKKGIKIPIYHSYDCDDNESYHFKELGWFFLNPGFTIPLDDKEIMDKIRALGMSHKHKHKGYDK